MNTETTTPDEKQRQALFHASTDRISKIWPEAADIRLQRHHPEAYTRLELMQDALNDTWLACQAKTADLKAFKAALADWETERFKAVQLLAKGVK